MIKRGPDAARVITTTKTLIEGVIVNRCFRNLPYLRHLQLKPMTQENRRINTYIRNQRTLFLFLNKVQADTQEDRNNACGDDNSLHLFVSPHLTQRQNGKSEHNEPFKTVGSYFLALILLPISSLNRRGTIFKANKHLKYTPKKTNHTFQEKEEIPLAYLKHPPESF